MENCYRIGLDIGSTTIKAVVLDSVGEVVFSCYERHNAQVKEKITDVLTAVQAQLGDVEVAFHITGSVGMGVAERCGLPFEQEVVAATNYVREKHSEIATMIDIGGEDAKIVFFRNGETTDLRMNGNCAGGTGAFIDQMAILLNVTPEQLNELASEAERIHPIASRCGVFSKTDIQNLIAKNVNRKEIAASVFHAVAVQVVVTLAHGRELNAPILFCGGPLTFLPALRKAFIDYLHLNAADVVVPEHSQLIPAYGSALAVSNDAPQTLSSLKRKIADAFATGLQIEQTLQPIFKDKDDYAQWRKRITFNGFRHKALTKGRETVTIGIDSGSTTTKIVVLNDRDEIIYSFYHSNNGKPVETVSNGLQQFMRECEAAGTDVVVKGSCSTGYGEDLIKAAFHLDAGIIETIAHYTAARYITNDVSFILDIGGQDMKAMFVSDGVINRIEINEACSSGCGSFIETFAKSLGFSLEDFAKEANKAANPYDLGTRCTVFMNSKVKQALREGATIADIAAGLSYSVIKNCLYKVLRLKNTDELGKNIVVQGGTMKNDSVVRAFEKLIGCEVYRSECPELMGAVGCALSARSVAREGITVEQMLQKVGYTTREQQCHGCENQCQISVFRFDNGNRYFSGTRCEKFFNNKGKSYQPGRNAYTEKLSLLFDRQKEVDNPVAVIGIPRCLNMFEEYPFWHTLFTSCGLQVVRSSPSTYASYESKAGMVMSDNICFPAKLVHSHIQDLVNKNVDRVFMPFVIFERPDGGQNSYNCPIVTGYSDVIKSVQGEDAVIDSPAITFKDKKLLRRQCETYLAGLGIGKRTFKKAFEAAVAEQEKYEEAIISCDREILAETRAKGKMTILLAGRPYHADPLVQHKLSDMIAAMGVGVITDDIVRHEPIEVKDVHFMPQWSYPNRILRAAKWVARQDDDVQCMQMTSFGCGPDAFLLDETRSLLKRYDKTLTLLKIDDVSNIGSIRLRVRSAIESLRLANEKKKLSQIPAAEKSPAFDTTPIFGKEDKRRKILVPFFTPFFSPLIPSIMKVAGYDGENLPLSDEVSCDMGLKYANNEVCYPATLIVGDIVKAFKQGRHDPANTAVAITQTGGQCRASNYLSLIKKALTEAGYGDVPVVSLTFGDTLENNQPGFKINWFHIIPITVNAMLFSDCIAKFYYSAACRERIPGDAERLKDQFLTEAQGIIERNKPDELTQLTDRAAREFDKITVDREVPRVGIVGEIFLKFNDFAQRDVCKWLVSKGIEVVPPMLSDFFVQTFVNREVNQNAALCRKTFPNRMLHWLYGKIWKKMEKYNTISSQFRYYAPFDNIYEKAERVKGVVSLNAQFGEGWLLPGEILSLASQGVNHVISLQPFGCIANHIVSKGIENSIKRLYPDMNILSLDFDSGVSGVNMMNRLLLFTNSLEPSPVEA